jgi:3-methylcrotonyl-CoA carboxylase alpha subunit
VYSEADRDALHVAMADEAVHIGAAPPRESYLDAGRILDACRQTGAEAVHPGYGFLSENAAFAEACVAAGLAFIGPPAGAIKAMGSKSPPRPPRQAGVPRSRVTRRRCRPNACGARPANSATRRCWPWPAAARHAPGAAAAGSRRRWRPHGEAASAFGNDDMLVEKYLERPRHVEMQVFCDRHGGAVYLFERDCSVQRRHQKVIEEAPAPGMTTELRTRMGEAAVQAARAIDYEGAGTVEFLLDAEGRFYFMEMNTRLQVEHPVTEMITGQDLVEWQLRVAAGEPLPLSQTQLRIDGHAFEARIYAEDRARFRARHRPA